MPGSKHSRITGHHRPRRPAPKQDSQITLALETPRLLSLPSDAHPATPYAANPTAPARVSRMLSVATRTLRMEVNKTPEAERPPAFIQLFIALVGFAVVAYCGFVMAETTLRSVEAYRSLEIFPEQLVREPRASFRSTIIWSIVGGTVWLFFFIVSVRQLFFALRQTVTPTLFPK